jgi:hypothetical protein
MRIPFVCLTLAAALSACTFAAAPSAKTDEPPAVTLAAEGEPWNLDALESTSEVQWAASVVNVDYLENQTPGAGVKLFGLAGGDPAMNGLYTHIAFFQNPGDGWTVFRLGDFLSYRVIADSPSRVDLEINESTMNAETGEIGSNTYYAIVSWTPGADGAPPQAVVMTRANSN